jgi:hypothetical protein
MNPSNRGEDDPAKGASGDVIVLKTVPGNDTIVALVF